LVIEHRIKITQEENSRDLLYIMMSIVDITVSLFGNSLVQILFALTTQKWNKD
jgi:hypothetical protein